MKPLSDIKNVRDLLEETRLCSSLKDAIAFACQWEEYRKNQSESKESCYGLVVGEVLRDNGIDIDKISKKRWIESVKNSPLSSEEMVEEALKNKPYLKKY